MPLSLFTAGTNKQTTQLFSKQLCFASLVKC